MNLVLCWHMHQPHYRVGIDGEYKLPWVYLHGIKDYTDMAAHLENNPDMHAVVNFAPVLLEQLDDYAAQLKAFLKKGTPTQDSTLNLLLGATPIPADIKGREEVIRVCRRCHEPRLIKPYPAFDALVGCVDRYISDQPVAADKQMLAYLDEHFFYDLLTWYHIAWLGESIKQQEAVKELMLREKFYRVEDRIKLAEVMHDSLQGLIPRYRKLAKSGQVELSMTPYGHPIIPLLNDFDNMRCALPDAPAPQAALYPEGAERSRWHIQHGLEVFEHYFGFQPNGVWLSEGGVSADALDMLDECDIQWTATGEGVWRNSCHLSEYKREDVESKRALFSPFQHGDNKVKLFFRDDGLSDRIGFEYSNWNADDAVADFMHHLDNIANFLANETEKDEDDFVVSVILDGENAWEYYPHNGYIFLDTLYKTLAASERFKTLTFTEAADKVEENRLAKLCPGSWVYGSFSTWIGQVDKNQAWDYLVAAKQCFDEVIESGELSKKQRQQVTRQLAICEGSDWFWWFGDYNSADSVKDFESLFRLQLKRLYSLLNKDAPDALDVPLSSGGGHSENAGTMRRN